MRQIFLFIFFGSLFGEGVKGNWGGLRKKLENEGVTITSTYGTDFMGNVSGGKRKRLEYAGFFDVSLALDFEKMKGPKGLSLVISNSLLSGQNLSNSVGNFFTIQELYSAGNYFLGEVKFAWSAPSEKITLEWGRLVAGDVFATNEFWQYYITSGLNGNLEAIPGNIFFPSFNIAAWSIRAAYNPNKNFEFLGAVYDADRKVEEIDQHGTYFPLKIDQGYLALFQGRYKHHGHYPGTLSLGGYYLSSVFEELENPLKKHKGKTGAYLIIDQMVYSKKNKLFAHSTYVEKAKQSFRKHVVNSTNHPQGLTLWGAGYYAPDKKVNLLRCQLGGGLLYRGFSLKRPEDVSAFGVIGGKFNKADTEIVIELNHRFQLGSSFYLTPDLQYILHPSGNMNIPNALVLGIESCMNF